MSDADFSRPPPVSLILLLVPWTQVATYACIYTSKASNLARVSHHLHDFVSSDPEAIALVLASSV